MSNFDEPLPIYNAQDNDFLFEYFVETNVPGNVLTTIISYTALEDMKIDRIMGFGPADADWELYIDTVLKVSKRSNPQEPDIDWMFMPTSIPLKTGQILTVKFQHNISALLNYNATLIMRKEKYRYG